MTQRQNELDLEGILARVSQGREQDVIGILDQLAEMLGLDIAATLQSLSETDEIGKTIAFGLALPWRDLRRISGHSAQHALAVRPAAVALQRAARLALRVPKQ